MITQWSEEITIISNRKNSSASSIFCIYIGLQTQVYIIKQKLILALLNDFQISEELKSLIALPCKLGGMGIINLIDIANEEYLNSRELTKKLTNLIIQLEHSCTVAEDEIKAVRPKIQKKLMEKQQ